MDPHFLEVLAVRDRVSDVSLGDDADRLAGHRVHDHQGSRAGVFHQVGGRGHVVVRFDRRDLPLHDIPQR
jgi:hypothetical protein